MKFPLSAQTVLVPLSIVILSACGSEEPDDGEDSETSPSSGDIDTDADSNTNTDGDSDTEVDYSDNYYPIYVGAYWTYLETATGGSTIELTYSVTGKETKDFGGDTGSRDVFIYENTFDGNNEKRIQFIEDDGVRAVRLGHIVFDLNEAPTKERYYEPGFLRFDRTKTTKGETWDETIVRTTDTLDDSAVRTESITYTYKVISVGEPLTIGLGTFNCIAIERTDKVDFETKYYWYAPGIGKIREQTGEKVEELIASSFTD